MVQPWNAGWIGVVYHLPRFHLGLPMVKPLRGSCDIASNDSTIND